MYAGLDRGGSGGVLAGDEAFVLLSKGKPFARAIVVEKNEERWLVRYGDGSHFRVRPENLIRIYSKGLVACATTTEYRLAARTQPREGEYCVEIGCDLGSCCERLAKAVGDTGRVLGVDKALDRLEIARARYPSLSFMHSDVFVEDKVFGMRPDVVFIDINGSREYDTVARLVEKAQLEWNPRLLVVKSSHYVRKHFPHSLPSEGAPERLLRHPFDKKRKKKRVGIASIVLHFLYTPKLLRKEFNPQSTQIKRLVVSILGKRGIS